MLETPQLPVPAAASHLPSLRDLSSPRAVAQISIGQGEAWVTPLHMAMLAATIANGGYAVQPYLIESVGEQIVKPSVAKNRVISAGVVQYVAEAMRSVVTNGSGRRAAVSGVAVSGKTGTAQNPGNQDHAWFIGCKGKDRTLESPPSWGTPGKADIKPRRLWQRLYKRPRVTALQGRWTQL